MRRPLNLLYLCKNGARPIPIVWNGPINARFAAAKRAQPRNAPYPALPACPGRPFVKLCGHASEPVQAELTKKRPLAAWL